MSVRPHEHAGTACVPPRPHAATPPRPASRWLACVTHGRYDALTPQPGPGAEHEAACESALAASLTRVRRSR
jgi:hypothetical protein